MFRNIQIIPNKQEDSFNFTGNYSLDTSLTAFGNQTYESFRPTFATLDTSSSSSSSFDFKPLSQDTSLSALSMATYNAAKAAEFIRGIEPQKAWACASTALLADKMYAQALSSPENTMTAQDKKTSRYYLNAVTQSLCENGYNIEQLPPEFKFDLNLRTQDAVNHGVNFKTAQQCAGLSILAEDAAFDMSEKNKYDGAYYDQSLQIQQACDGRLVIPPPPKELLPASNSNSFAQQEFTLSQDELSPAQNKATDQSLGSLSSIANSLATYTFLTANYEHLIRAGTLSRISMASEALPIMIAAEKNIPAAMSTIGEFDALAAFNNVVSGELNNLRQLATPIGKSIFPLDIFKTMVERTTELDKPYPIREAITKAKDYIADEVHINPSTLKWLGKLAKGAAVLSAGITAYKIGTSEDKLKTAGEEARKLIGGFIGAAQGSTAAFTLAAVPCAATGPLAPICTTTASVTGAVIGGIVGTEIVENIIRKENEAEAAKKSALEQAIPFYPEPDLNTAPNEWDTTTSHYSAGLTLFDANLNPVNQTKKFDMASFLDTIDAPSTSNNNPGNSL